MKISRAVKFFSVGLEKGLKKNPTLSRMIASLDKAVKKKIGRRKDIHAQVRDFSGEHLLDPHSQRLVQVMPNIGLVLYFGENNLPDVPRLYSEIENLDLNDVVSQVPGLVLSQAPPLGVLSDYKVSLYSLTGDHSLIYPIGLSFNNNFDGIKEQRNQIRIACKGDPSEFTKYSIEKACEDLGVNHKLMTSRKTESFAFNGKKYYVYSLSHNGMLTYGLLAPEVILEAEWNGSNFDNKGMRVYGTLRSILYPTHIKETVKNIEVLMGRECNESYEGAVYSNQESRNMGEQLSDLSCNFSCHVPFKHKDSDLVGHLFYKDFRGK